MVLRWRLKKEELVRRIPEHIQETRTLYDILPPKSSSSGREFARIVNLLLFHDGRRNGRTVSIFDDRAGDYLGLDAFETKGKSIAVGYQHKFFPSPMGGNYRGNIEHSLQTTIESLKKREIHFDKWILITPQDFIQSATRKTGGDVSWFEGLSKKYKLPFAIEHWGHTQLQALFIETPSIGLYYYPELFTDGALRRKTIQSTRTMYDEALKKEHGRIEFVGMSVYKQEAARAVPMENIYIPLSVIPNDANENDPEVPRRNPIDFLTPGMRHVILGDPGAGKTTLLKFLALFGQSEPLQQRFGAASKEGVTRFESDDRLPIFIRLRRYADALKNNADLSIIEYIRRNIAADFSISDISGEFIAYYLESAKAVLLFDGLDELPNPSFKVRIRNRIRTLAASYPGNTIVVSSRIYGYDSKVGFEDNYFHHHRLAKLRIEEIEQFARDWYDARLERPHDREEYLGSLLGILRNEEHVAIRELARNPLLLTIIVLVHRIDAVLPDERHVLYQKCTETLLNTWHTWKFHDMDRLHRAKVDRLNMQRMQAIAYWMHHEMGKAESGRQSVVPYKALHDHLTKHIRSETPPNPEYAAEDIATAFIEFVQDRAGLLMEIGEQKFSFIHLTFQEYLTAAHIKTLSELNGVKDAWGTEIVDHCGDPRWREVIRLLVAAYGSDVSQEFLVDSILTIEHAAASIAQLLGGLLLDGVAAAQMKKEKILELILIVASNCDEASELKSTMNILRLCRSKIDGESRILPELLASISPKRDADGRTRLRLTGMAIGVSLEDIWNSCGCGPRREAGMLSLLAGSSQHQDSSSLFRQELKLLSYVAACDLLEGPEGNFYAVLFQSVHEAVNPELGRQRTFDLLLTTLAGGQIWNAPPPYLLSYLLQLSQGVTFRRYGWALARALVAAPERDERVAGVPTRTDLGLQRDLCLIRALERVRTRDLPRDKDHDQNPRHEYNPLAMARDLAFQRVRALASALRRDRVLKSHGKERRFVRDEAVNEIPSPDGTSSIWRYMSSDPTISVHIAKSLSDVFGLEPVDLWQETIMAVFLPSLVGRIHAIDFKNWQVTNDHFTAGMETLADIYAASFQLIIDGLLFVTGYHDPDEYWLRKHLGFDNKMIAEHTTVASESRTLLSSIANKTRGRHEAPLRIAHCIRDLAYGDETSIDNFEKIVSSNSLVYRKIFERCFWRPEKEELKRGPRKRK
jgi:hypothetical protein